MENRLAAAAAEEWRDISINLAVINLEANQSAAAEEEMVKTLAVESDERLRRTL